MLRFYQKAQCIIDQYSGFEALPGMFVDGELTAGENIADNGGLREAYLAYRNWVQSNNGGDEEPRLPGLEQFSPDQLFYLGYANVSSLAPFFLLYERTNDRNKFSALVRKYHRRGAN